MTYDAFKGAVRAQGLTMEELAEKMGMTRPTLQGRLEQPKSMTIVEIEKLSEILGIEGTVIIH